MKLTATMLTTQFTCGFLRHVMYEAKQPLPVLGTGRQFGNVIHAVLEAYHKTGRSLERALDVLKERGRGLRSGDLGEARSILEWTHDRKEGRGGRPLLIEGPLWTSVGGHRLIAQVDRLDAIDGGLRLTEYKGGKRVDLRLVRVQLAILAYAIASVFGRAPIAWELEVLRARKVIALDPIRDPRELERFTATLAGAVARGDRDPRPYDPDFCRACPARPWCPRVARSPKPLGVGSSRQDPQLVLF